MISENKKKWDARFMKVAQYTATWSKDPSTKVGALLVSARRPLASGFNGFPKGHPDDPELYADREYKYQHIVHAEINALDQAIHFCSARVIRGSTMYLNFPPCPDCVRAMAVHGIARVVYLPLELTEGYQERGREWVEQWQSAWQESRRVAQESVIQLEPYYGQ